MALDNNQIGVPFIELQSVESTNNYAMALVHEGMARHGTAVFAHEQTKGKGQRNKQWLTNKSENIILSVVLEPWDLVLSQSFQLSMAIALATYRFFNKYAGEETKIKWPNDIYWRDRKAAGILLENVLQGSSWKYAIIGIGININQSQFGELSHKAVSLKQITGKEYSVVLMAQELCNEIAFAFNALKQDAEQIAVAYHQCLYKINNVVKLKKENRVFDTTIKGVTSLGQLVTYRSTEELFDIGEVEWII